MDDEGTAGFPKSDARRAINKNAAGFEHIVPRGVMIVITCNSLDPGSPCVSTLTRLLEVLTPQAASGTPGAVALSIHYPLSTYHAIY